MKNKEQSNVVIKSNVTLKSRGAVPPIDNMPKEYFDVRLDSSLTPEQKAMKIKMLFWTENVFDENKNTSKDECYRGCINCGENNNHCKRPQNKTGVEIMEKNSFT